MIPKETVDAMYADYQSGMSLVAVAHKYGGRSNKTLHDIFKRRGLALRVHHVNPIDPETGCFAPAKPLTEVELSTLIDSMTKIAVPPRLQQEWRKWSLEKRASFLARVRARIKSPDDRPITPFSSNVEPWDYTTPRAHAICKKENAGRNSRSAPSKLKVVSQGVIWRDRLFFWCRKIGYSVGPWRFGSGRPTLHHLIWEEENGRKIPPQHTVIFLDGNHNNFDPANLRLRSRSDCAQQNKSRFLLKHSREITKLLLTKSQTKNHEHIDNLKALKAH